MKHLKALFMFVTVLGLVLGLSASAAEVQSDTITSENNMSDASFGVITDVDATGRSPTFIKAMGTNGVEGYIRFDDVYQPAANPEAANEYMKTLTPDTYWEVPLYASDGITVIGEFRVCSGLE